MASALRSTLPEHMTTRYVAGIMKTTGTFRKKRVIVAGAFVTLRSWFYETGAVLGRARRNKLETMARMFAEPGREKSAADWVLSLADKRVASYEGTPTSFLEFFVTTEPSVESFEWFLHAGKEEFLVDDHSIQDLRDEAQLSFMGGIGFGVRFPDLTETMWISTHESPDAAIRADARIHGLEVPQQTAKISLQEREKQVLDEVASYAFDRYPELHGLLDFSSP